MVTGFLDIYIVGRVLKAFFESNVTNRLFQVSSRDYVTRYEFARLMAKTFRKDENLIQRTSIPFPVETSNTRIGVKAPASQYYFKMDTFNVEEFLGLKMPSVEESIQLTFKRLTEQRLA